MKRSVDTSEYNIRIMISIVKIGIIFFTEITIYKNLSNYWNVLGGVESNFNLSAMGILLCNTIIILIFWFLITKNKLLYTLRPKVSLGVEMAFFVCFLSFAMYLSNSYQSEVKYIFLLLIIVSVIQYGLRYGIITTLICSFIILGFDFIYAPTINGINKNFEGDLIIVGIYVFVTWVLGYYVDIEKEYKKRTEEKLYMLSNELEASDKSRHSIEEMLLKNNICFEMLFENSENALIVHKDGKIIYANESTARLLGYDDPLKLNEALLYKYYPKDCKGLIENKYTNICNNKLSKVIEEENILDCFGNSIAVRNTSSFFIYEGKPAVLTFLLNITSEKEIEALKKDVENNERLLSETREYNALITEFFTNISHEIKTPINVIYVAIQTMDIYVDKCSGSNADKCKSYLKMMKQNCFRLMRLVNNLLDITRLDSGFLKLNSENNNIVSVVEDITLSVANYIESKDIELIFDTNVEEKIMAFDHDKIERIILNLLSNAFKYTYSGGKICVTLEDKGESVTISVKDEGEGIPEDKQESIFERFEQANRSLSRQNEGSGIGLYLVKSFVEMHGGNIKVISSEGEGSEFIISLPAVIVENGENKINAIYESKIERINIEFSDIYSIQNYK